MNIFSLIQYKSTHYLRDKIALLCRIWPELLLGHLHLVAVQDLRHRQGVHGLLHQVTVQYRTVQYSTVQSLLHQYMACYTR